jgi:GDPmannose 4,6-dehydratase
MLQHDVPEDFVLATGETHSVREFVELAFKAAGFTLSWSGSGENEIATDQTGRVVLRVDPAFYRPADVEVLIGNNAKAKRVLGWTPKTSFQDMITAMVNLDCSE